ncbi:MAG TPA: DUF3352 domain-containing protein [Solirubrobacterales bacterium]|nr:DUF3352 domain-containing protein [Solirubrobacterales bacterium]
MKSRLLFVALAATALAALAGCGGGSSGADVASLAPPGVPVFVEGNLRPEGDLKANVNAIAKQVAGVDDLGEFVAEELESAATGEGESLDFEKEVEPWLGEHGGVFFEQLEGSDFSGTGILVESTDTEATQEFIDKHDEATEGRKVGMVGDFLVIAENQKVFKEVEDASDGESLGDEDTFSKAISAASDGSIADIFVDVGKLIEQGGGQIDPTARQILRNAGIDPSEATAVASIVPGSEQIAVELSSDLAGEEAPTGDASSLLGELPGSAFAGFAVTGFGKQLEGALDSLDAEGIPGTVPPHQLRKGLKQLGIDLEGFAGSLQDAAVFATGANRSSLGGALVLSTKGSEATKAIGNIGLLLRHVHVAGVTALNGKYSGFSVHSDELGDKPLVVMAKEGRVAIGYGVAPTVAGLTSGSGAGKTLSDDPAYSDAVASLGNTPIGGFADGPGALHLADALIPSSEEGFEKAKKYLKSIRFLALGSASQGELATAKLIIGLK